MADYSELKRRAQEIKDEVKAGANTANRVGLALEETVKALEAENKRAEQAEESLENAVQMLQDETEDLQSIRDEVERLGNDKADKSALEATNKEVSKKQNKLDNYKEDPSNGSVEIFAQDKVSVSNDSQGGVSCVEVYNEEDTEGIIPVARMSADKENGDYASVTVRGNEVHIDGDAVKVNGVDLENFRTTVVNDLTTGGADKALSAEMGKELSAELAELGSKVNGNFIECNVSVNTHIPYSIKKGENYIIDVKESVTGAGAVLFARKKEGSSENQIQLCTLHVSGVTEFYATDNYNYLYVYFAYTPSNEVVFAVRNKNNNYDRINEIGNRVTTIEDSFGELELKLEDVVQELRPSVPLEEAMAAGSGYRLSGEESGIAIQNSLYELRKYKVEGNKYLYLKLSDDYEGGGTYQFQNVSSVSATASTQIPRMIGVPVKGEVDGFVEIPEGAIYLITSQLQTNTTNVVNIASESLSKRLGEYDKKIQSVETKIDNKKTLEKGIVAGRMNIQTDYFLKSGISYTLNVSLKNMPAYTFYADIRTLTGDVISETLTLTGKQFGSLVYTPNKDYENIVVSLYSGTDASAEYAYISLEGNNSLMSKLEELQSVNSIHGDIVSLNEKSKTELWLKNVTFKAKTGIIYEPYTFIHFSDIHGDSENLKRIVDFRNHYNSYINDSIHTGDTTLNTYSDGVEFWNNIAGSEKIINIVGNHDTAVVGSYNGANGFTSQDIYSLLMGNISSWGVVYEEGKNYFYKDIPSSNLRIIFLDYIFWDNVQIEWLEGLLESAKENGLSVLIFNHTCPSTSFECIESSFTSLQWKPEYNTNEGAISAVDAFIESGGSFVGWFVGHSHFDYICKIGSKNQLVVVVDTSKCNEGYSDARREKNERSQDLFNLVSVDVSSKTIRIKRIGSNTDRWGRSKNTICVNYSTGEVVWNN